MMFITAAICWYVFGVTIFIMYAGLGYQNWADVYYIWDKVKDVLFIAALLKPDYIISRFTIKIILCYSILRVIWEMVSIITDTYILDQRGTSFLFAGIGTGLIALLIRDLATRWKQKP